MSKYKSILFIIMAFTASSCTLLGDLMGSYGNEHYRIQIDSVYTPPGISLDDSIRISLWGVIGRDTCHTFSHFQSAAKNNELDLTVWGFLIDTYRRGCPSANRNLDGKIFYVHPEWKGPFFIRIHQPDGTTLYREVNVY